MRGRLQVRHRLRAHSRRSYTEALTAGCNRHVHGTCYCVVCLFVNWEGEKGEQMNSKICKCLRYLWVSQEEAEDPASIFP